MKMGANIINTHLEVSLDSQNNIKFETQTVVLIFALKCH